jgi:hypothetical protein
VNSKESELEDNLLGYVEEHYSDYDGYKDDCVEIVKNTSDGFYKITEIYEAVQNAIDENSIPALYLELDLDENAKSSILVAKKEKEADNEKEEPEETNLNPQNDEIEELFIRLNSAGTPLGGEELNYSLLKSCIGIESSLKEEIEKACECIMKPARFITIMYRLYQNTTGEESSESLQMKIKPKLFQKAIRSNELGQTSPFIKFLEKIVGEKSYNGKNLLEYFRAILEFGQQMDDFSGKEDDYRLPNLLVSKISATAPELVFLLLYRIYKKEDRFTFCPLEHKMIGTSAHRKMIGIMLLFMWLSDTSKSIQNIWKVVKFNLPTDKFWSDLLVESAGDTLAEFPSNDQHLKNLNWKKKNFNLWNDKEWDWGEHDYSMFYDVLFWNKDILLYAQRNFISNWFKPKQFHLDDTNIPFDWDHISPKKFARGSARAIKDIYESNGNFRAWPYSLNRSDQDDTPSEKFSLQQENIEEIRPILKQEVLQKFGIKGTTPESIKKFFLASSFCENEKWEECDANNFRSLEDCRKLYPLIIGRLYNLYNELRENLLFDELHTKSSDIVGLDYIFNSNLWRNSLQKRTENENIKNLPASSNNLFFYYIHNTNDEDENDDKTIEFGLVEIGKEKPHYWDKKNSSENWEDIFWLFSSYSLPCHHKAAYSQFLKEFENWLKNVPLKNISRNDIIANFKKGISGKI